MKIRIAVVLSHPIQHFAPQFRSWSRRPDVALKVLYGSSKGLSPYHDPSFNTTVTWGESVASGYDLELLDEALASPAPLRFQLDSRILDYRLSEFDPHVVVTYGYAQLLQFRARRWGIRNGRHLAYISDSENRQLAGKQRSWSKRRAVGRFLRPYRTLLTVGDANEEYYRSLGIPGERMLRMRFPVDVDSYEDAWLDRKRLRDETRASFGIHKEDVAALVVGKLIDRKRQIDAMQACESALPECNVKLILAGSGPNDHQLQQWAAETRAKTPVFAGFVDVHKLPAMYAAADLLIHPSSIDPHPLAISEAIYMGLPVLVSERVGSWGPSDDVIEGQNGYVFKPGDIAGMRTLIERLASDHSLRETLGNRSRSMAVQYQARAHGDFIPELLARIH